MGNCRAFALASDAHRLVEEVGVGIRRFHALGRHQAGFQGGLEAVRRAVDERRDVHGAYGVMLLEVFLGAHVDEQPALPPRSARFRRTYLIASVGGGGSRARVPSDSSSHSLRYLDQYIRHRRARLLHKVLGIVECDALEARSLEQLRLVRPLARLAAGDAGVLADAELLRERTGGLPSVGPRSRSLEMSWTGVEAKTSRNMQKYIARSFMTRIVPSTVGRSVTIWYQLVGQSSDKIATDYQIAWTTDSASREYKMYIILYYEIYLLNEHQL